MPSGWENAPDYGSRGGWLSTIAALIFVIALGLSLVNCSVQPSAKSAETQTETTIAGTASVIDGDTIEIHGRRIRLSGFDTPERGARCGDVNVYQRAALALSDFIGQRTVTCTPTGVDNYDRVVASCGVDGTDLGEHVVAQGWGRDWPRYSNGAYADEESDARENRRGIWGLECPADLWGERNYSR